MPQSGPEWMAGQELPPTVQSGGVPTVQDTTPRDLPANTLSSYDPRKSRMGAQPGGMLDDSIDLSSMTFDEEVEKGVQDDFTFGTILGQGGMGEVWEGIQVRLDRTVAIKRMRRDFMASEGSNAARRAYWERGFCQEAITTANLDHPNILPVYDLGRDMDASPIMAMKLIRGKAWHDLIWEDWPNMSREEFLARHIPILATVTQAIAFAHSRGVIHRDLKPAQIMIGEFGEVFVCDWGLAVVFSVEALGGDRKGRGKFLPTPVSASNPAGTPAFMAPEQTETTAVGIGPWTDIFLLGGMLYYLLTLRTPHHGDNTEDVFHQARLGVITPAHEVARQIGVPMELSELAAAAMKPNPKDRVASAREFLTGLQSFLSGSNKRRESAELTELVEMGLDWREIKYEVFAESLTQLMRASALWGGNPLVAPLRERANEGMARLAIDNGDLGLARLHASTLAEGPKRAELMTAVQLAEEARLAAERHRVQSRRALIALGAVTICIVIFFLWRMTLQRNEAMRERDSAQAARAGAQRLVSFMLEDLFGSLQSAGQLEPLVKVSNEVMDYYMKLPEGQESRETRLQRLHALSTSAHLQREMGDSRKAQEIAEEYVRQASALVAMEPGDMTWLEEEASALALRSRVLMDVGDQQGSQDALRDAIGSAIRSMAAEDESIDAEGLIKLLGGGQMGHSADSLRVLLGVLDKMDKTQTSDAEWMRNIAYGYDRVAEGLTEAGELDEAEKTHLKALAIRENLVGAGELRDDQLSEYFQSHVFLGRVAERAHRLEQALVYAEQGRLIAEEQSRLHPSPQWSASLSLANGMVGSVQLQRGNIPDARKANTMAVQMARSLAERDPLNAAWQENLAMRLSESSELLVAEGYPSGAADESDKALEIIAKLVTLDSQNLLFKRDLCLLYAKRAELVKVLESADEAKRASQLESTTREKTEPLIPAMKDLAEWKSIESSMSKDLENSPSGAAGS